VPMEGHGREAVSISKPLQGRPSQRHQVDAITWAQIERSACSGSESGLQAVRNLIARSSDGLKSGLQTRSSELPPGSETASLSWPKFSEFCGALWRERRLLRCAIGSARPRNPGHEGPWPSKGGNAPGGNSRQDWRQPVRLRRFRKTAWLVFVRRCAVRASSKLCGDDFSEEDGCSALPRANRRGRGALRHVFHRHRPCLSFSPSPIVRAR